MKPIVNSLTPSAIRAEHSEIENLRLENKNLVAQLDSSRSELATAQKTVEELKAKKMSEVTPALIMDYAKVQAERDSLRSKLQTAMEERDQWKCSAQLYHEELRRLADGRKVETNLAHPVEEKIATANSRLEEAEEERKRSDQFREDLRTQIETKWRPEVAQLEHARDLLKELLEEAAGVLRNVSNCKLFYEDSADIDNYTTDEVLTLLSRLSKPNDP